MGIEKDSILALETTVKKEEEEGVLDNSSVLESKNFVKKEEADVMMDDAYRLAIVKKEKVVVEEYEKVLVQSHCALYLNPRPIRAIGPPTVTDQRVLLVTEPDSAELGEFPEEPDWFLVGKTYVSWLSTCRGRRKIDASEIVYFNFPKNDGKQKYGGKWATTKTAAATSEIVRFSTKRSEEIGRLPPEWSRCLIPLVHSSKVKIHGRCVFVPFELSLMQEIMLYVSFYINSSDFTEGDKSSFKLEVSTPMDPTVCPLPTLFRLLKMKPLQKAEFTPEELDTQKRSLNLRDNAHADDESQIVGLAKRRRGGGTYAEQSNDEQVISESSLNKLVGTAELYDLKI